MMLKCSALWDVDKCHLCDLWEWIICFLRRMNADWGRQQNNVGGCLCVCVCCLTAVMSKEQDCVYVSVLHCLTWTVYHLFVVSSKSMQTGHIWCSYDLNDKRVIEFKHSRCVCKRKDRCYSGAVVLNCTRQMYHRQMCLSVGVTVT